VEGWVWCTFQNRDQRRATPIEHALSVPTPAEFARERLGFQADDKQRAV
jgi:hypothetical protein